MDDDPASRRLTNGGMTVGQRFDRLETRAERTQERIDEGFRQLQVRLESSATRRDVDAVRSRLEILEREGSWHVKDLLKALDLSVAERRDLQRRVEVLERGLQSSDSVSEALEVYKRWLVGIALTVCGLVLVVLTNFVTLHRF